jgi:hypothetical protein
MNLAMYCKNVDMFKIIKEEIDTHKLYSLIIPNLINFSDGKVNITNGKLLTGTMGDNILNQRIVYYSWDRHGSDITKNFYDNAQRLVTNWLLINGFSVGLGDATTSKVVTDDIKAFCEVKQMEIDKLITEMENNPETLDPDTFETNILSSLKASDGEITKKVYEHLKPVFSSMIKTIRYLIHTITQFKKVFKIYYPKHQNVIQHMINVNKCVMKISYLNQC